MSNKYDKILGEYRENDRPFTSDVRFVESGYTLELWFKNQLMHTWTADAPVVGPGQPIGLLLSITYS